MRPLHMYVHIFENVAFLPSVHTKTVFCVTQVSLFSLGPEKKTKKTKQEIVPSHRQAARPWIFGHVGVFPILKLLSCGIHLGLYVASYRYDVSVSKSSLRSLAFFLKNADRMDGSHVSIMKQGLRLCFY